MMYLSCLDLAADPLNRGVQLWLANPYRIHQRLCLAFSEPDRFLFRLEERPRLRLLVQSTTEPDWDRAFADFPAVLDGPPRSKAFRPVLSPGQCLRFFLRANPTVKRDGHRHGLFREEEQHAWLERKGRAGGFSIRTVRVQGEVNRVSRKGAAHGSLRMTHFTIDFEGLLQVIEVERFLETLGQGIGSAKAYGFGLLSLAPA